MLIPSLHISSLALHMCTTYDNKSGRDKCKYLHAYMSVEQRNLTSIPHVLASAAAISTHPSRDHETMAKNKAEMNKRNCINVSQASRTHVIL